MHEEMLNISGHERNAHQNNIEISPHSSQIGYHQLYLQQQAKRNPYTLLIKMQISATAMESNMEVLQKTKNRTIIEYSDTAPADISEGM
jgi:hypothetical protein